MQNQSKSRLIFIALLAIAFFSYRSYLKRNPVKKSLEEKRDLVDRLEDVVTSGPLEPESPYKGNRLENGASPFDALYGKGAYSKSQHSLTIKNTGSSDVIVFLVSMNGDKVLRNEYVRANSFFELTNIPESTCYVKYYYGSNWNPTRVTRNVVTGGFDNNEQHIISNEPSDVFSFKEEVRGDYIYSSNYVITLETIKKEGTTMSEQKIAPAEFF